MKKDDFNLISEPWVRVRMPDATIGELSMLQLFEQAGQIRALAGELPTQDVAVLRLLLAVLHTVFSRFDADGNRAALACPDDALDRWQAIWERKSFPAEVIAAYLDGVKDRFWLFDEETPFYQFPAVRKIAGLKPDGQPKSSCSAKKLNGSISESENKTSLFSARAGAEKDSLTYAEAARWLIHIVSYDDSALKPSGRFKEKEKAEKKKAGEGPGVGWLGKLGVVYAEGDNLFETLMLNLVMLDNNGELWKEERPLWEQAKPEIHEREKTKAPDNLAELLTFPSRYVLLRREGGKVTDYCVLGGMFFDPALRIEQMTMRTGKKEKDSFFKPKKHEKEAFLWQEFEPIFVKGTENDDRRPGVVGWVVNQLQADTDPLISPEKTIGFRAVGMFYDSKNCSVTQVETDALSLHAGILSKLGEEWQKAIAEEIQRAEKISQKLGSMAEKIFKAAGGDAENARSARSAVKAKFFAALDIPFRKWLGSVSVGDDREAKVKEWGNCLNKSALNAATDCVENAGPAAYRGRIVKEKRGGKEAEVFYSAPQAYDEFLRDLYSLK